jgi:putative ATP-binding cassette transporter
LLYRPDWLFLDEASSALDQPTERFIHAVLIERLPHAALIRIAHTSDDPSPGTRQVIVDPWRHQVTTNAQAPQQCGNTREPTAEAGIHI